MTARHSPRRILELALLKKSDARKLAITNAIRLNAVVPNAWTAQEFKLGNGSWISRCWNAVVPPVGSAAFFAALEKRTKFVDFPPDLPLPHTQKLVSGLRRREDAL